MIKKLILSAISATLIFAQSPKEIMQDVQNRDDGDNIITNLQMQLIDKNNHKRVRDMKTFTKDIGKDTKSIIFFLLY